MSVVGVILVRIFPHSDWIFRISPYSVWMRENTGKNADQNNSDYGHFLRSVHAILYVVIMSRTRFRVNLHSVVCLNVRELFAQSRRYICRFTLNLVHDMIAYSQMHRTDKYSQHGLIIWPVWLNVWVFVYKLSGCGF